MGHRTGRADTGPGMRRVNSYDPNARLPKVGTWWVWEIDAPHARSLIKVVRVDWNGEEWWVFTTRGADPGDYFDMPLANDLGRFWEAVTPVGGPITSRVSERRTAR